jgi:hypothetical protein
MQDSTIAIPSLAVVTISMMLQTYTMKPRWIPAIGLAGTALVLLGMIRFYYFHQAGAKHLFSLPGIALMCISLILMIYKTIKHWKREHA